MVTDGNRLLDQQQNELDKLAVLLEAEYEALKSRDHTQLLGLAQQKAESLQKLSDTDAQISNLKQQLTPQAHQRIDELKRQLGSIKQANERNGKLLALSAASQGRLRGMLIPPERRAGTTYTKQGQKHHAGQGNCHFSV